MRNLFAMDRGRRRFMVRMAAVILPAALMIVVTAAFIADRGNAVLGPTAGTYTEANGDIIEICSDAACTSHTTSFAPNTRVYLRVTTTRVSNNSSGGNIRLWNYRGTSVATGTWTQTSATSPYSYTGSVLIPASSPNYLKVYGLVRNGTPRIQFEVNLDITTLPSQYMRFYSDAAHADESYTFRSGSVIYLTAYGSGNTYSAGNTGNRNVLYDFTNAATYTWATAPAVTQSTNWYNFSLTLPATGLTDGNWYNLRTWLRDTGWATIERMSDMIQIDNTPPVASISSPTSNAYIQGLAPVNGTASDVTSFYSYKLEYGAGAAPSTWTTIGTTAYTPVTSGVLQTWNTTGVTDGLYTLRLTVTDRAYNVSTATVQVNVDNYPPTITNVVAAGITSSSATISWLTSDKASSSQVRYGTISGVYTNSTTLDPALLNNHSQLLSALVPGTKYYYQVISTEAGGNTAVSPEFSFTTANLTVLQPYPAVGKDTNFGTGQKTWNRGAEDFLRVGNLTSDPNIGTTRSALRFDLGGIPSTANIVSATMSMFQIAQGDSTQPTLEAHQMTRDWMAGIGSPANNWDHTSGADWNTFDGATSWTIPGGDYSAGTSNSAGSSTVNTWVNWDLTTFTQSWVTAPATNYGMVIKDSNEAASTDLKRFYSSDYTADASLRPKLMIEWFPNPGPDTTPPNIGEIRAENIRLTAANIKWSTDESASSQVYYGTTTSYGAWTTADATLVNQHVVPLSSLSSDLDCHYKVVSIDPSGNRAESADQVFHTARQIAITASEDTWISGAAAKQSLNYGGSTDINVGENGAAEAQRGILKFDLTKIPLGSTVNSATLSVYQHAQADTSTPQLGVYYVSSTKVWTPGTGNGIATGDGATWLSYDGNGADSWTSPGGDGDFNATPSATANALDTSIAPDWVNWDVGTLAQSWVNGTIANNGAFIKKTSGSGATDYKSFYSTEYGATSLRPQLVIEYVPAPISITLTVNGTYNRDGTPGGGTAIDFGVVDPLKPYIVGSSASPPPAPPPYAVELSLQSNALWSLSVAASTDLLSQSNPADFINIANLTWRASGSASSWRSYQKTSDPVTNGSGVLTARIFDYDYQLGIPGMATPGNYNTSIVYTGAYAG